MKRKSGICFCPQCMGSGVVFYGGDDYRGMPRMEDCPVCGGCGFVEANQIGRWKPYAKGKYRGEKRRGSE